MQNSIQSLKQTINNILPDRYTPQTNKQAQLLFDSIDFNKNGYASLAEIDAGLKNILKLPVIPGLHTIIVKAYDKARISKKSESSKENKYVTKDQFIYMLIYLRIYYEFFIEFRLLDQNEDHQISLQEMEKGKQILKKWKVDTSNLLALFKQMDKDGRGTVSFRQFCDWGVSKYFALEFGSHQ